MLRQNAALGMRADRPIRSGNTDWNASTYVFVYRRNATATRNIHDHQNTRDPSVCESRISSYYSRIHVCMLKAKLATQCA